MADPFTGEIRAFGFNFAPNGWAFCGGQSLNIQQNAALFAVIGTAFGGDGITTFALPNLQGRVALGTGQGTGLSSYVVGELVGEDAVGLTTQEMPAHTHDMIAGLPATKTDLVSAPSAGAYLCDELKIIPTPVAGIKSFSNAAPNTTLAPQSLAATGQGQPHSNLQPYQVFNFCICLDGLFPQRQ